MREPLAYAVRAARIIPSKSAAIHGAFDKLKQA
jgi:hypothetical protein